MFSFLMPRPRRAQTASVVLTRATRPDLEQLETRTLLSTNIISFPSGSPAAGIEGAAANAGGVITFELRRYTDDPSQPLTVNLAAHGAGDYPATPGEDFVAPTTATFPAGEYSAYASVDVSVTDDDNPEPEETFALTVEPGNDYQVDAAAASPGQPGAIAESDVPYVWAQSSAAPGEWATATEGGDNATLYLKRDNTHGTLPVRYGLTGDWGPDGASASPDDYALVNGSTPDQDGLYTATFADGQDTIDLEIAAVDDTSAEPSREGFQVYLADPAAGYAAVAGVDKYLTGGYPDGQSYFATAIIQDNDYDINLSSNDSAIEGHDGAAGFNINRYGDLRQPLTVNFNITGSATMGEDYDSSPFDAGQVTFAPNQSDVFLPLTPMDDETAEWTEDVILTIPQAETYRINGQNFATDEIVDDELGSVGMPDDVMLSKSSSDTLHSVTLNFPLDAKPEANITLQASTNRINVWADSSKTTLLLDETSFPGSRTWAAGEVPFGNTVYIEVVHGSQTDNDVYLAVLADDAPTTMRPSNKAPQDTGTTVKLKFHSYREHDQDGTLVEKDLGNGDQASSTIIGEFNHIELIVEAPQGWVNGNVLWEIDGKPFKTWSPTNETATLDILDANAIEGDTDIQWSFAEPGSHQVIAYVPNSGGYSGLGYHVEALAPIVTQTTLTIGSPQLISKTVGNEKRADVAMADNTNPNNPGFVWKNTVQMPVKRNYEGLFSYVQLISDGVRLWDLGKDSGHNIQITTLFREWGLDTFYPSATTELSAPYDTRSSMGDENDGWQTGPTAQGFSDRPKEFLNSLVEGDNKRKADFQTYLMFNSGGVLDQWVPVKMVTWGFSVAVQAGASFVDGYQIVAASPAPGATAPVATATSDHPSWSINGKDFVFQEDTDQTTSVLSGPPN